MTIVSAREAEQRLLTPPPGPFPTPFDGAVSPKVCVDGLVPFQGPQYRLPFTVTDQNVELRRVAGAVQILKSCEVVAERPGGADARLLMDEAHDDAESGYRIIAPPPAQQHGAARAGTVRCPLVHSSIETCDVLAELAR